MELRYQLRAGHDRELKQGAKQKSRYHFSSPVRVELTSVRAVFAPKDLKVFRPGSACAASPLIDPNSFLPYYF